MTRRQQVRLTVTLGLLALALHTIRAQGEESLPAQRPELTSQQVQAAAKKAAERDDLDEDAKAAVKQSYDDALAALERAEAARKARDDFAAAIKTAPDATKEAVAARDALVVPDAPEQSVTSEERGLAPEELKGVLNAEEAALLQARETLQTLEQSVNREASRPEALPAEIEAAQTRVQEARAALADWAPGEAEASPREFAEQAKLEAELAAAQAELEKLEQERLSASVRGPLERARRDLQERKVTLAEQRVGELRRLVQARVNEIAESAIAVAEEAAEAAEAGEAGAPEMLVEDVRRYAKELEKTSQRIASVQQDIEALNKRSEELSDDYEMVLRQVETMEGSGSAAQILLDQRRVLPDPRMERRKMRNKESSLAEMRVARMGAEAELRRTLSVQEPKNETGKKLLAAKRSVLEELDEQYERLILARGALETNERLFLSRLEAFDELLSEKLFWVRSSPMIGALTISELPLALQWLAGPERWKELGRVVRVIVTESFVPLVALALLVAALLSLRGRFKRSLADHQRAIRSIRSDRYGLTMQALLITVLYPLPYALLMWAGGRLLLSDPMASPWLLGLAQGLQRGAPLLFGFLFWRNLCRKGGLGEAHFRWKSETMKRVRRTLTYVALVYVPAVVILELIFSDTSSRYIHSLGRIVFMSSMIWLALGVGFLIHPKRGVFRLHLENAPESLLSRTRYGWYLLAIFVPLFLVGLAAWGYLVTSMRLNGYLQATAGIAAGAAVAYALLLRWFTIRERKLALERTLEERQARREAARHQESASEAGEEGPEAVEEAMDLAEVGAQTRRLLRALAVSAAAVALWFAWADALPVLRGLDAEPILGQATAADVLVTLLVVVVTVVVAKNLPGILEIAVLRNLPLDSGARYAAATLAQYVIVGIGLIAIFQVMPFDWSQLGWMFAALSVGLGFGLQEIVANFVCGIILLFERPIRVGDIVTISGTSGTVSRIRMRATTITDWDRKELVVPNKEFITGQVLNWTLSNSTNRIVITVGVAYGSDTERARELLLEILHAHPDVADDPAPIVNFENFGESSLDFVVRCYLPNLDRRLGVTHELHSEIHRRFREAEIEIPFPQRDLHARSGWAALQRTEHNSSA